MRAVGPVAQLVRAGDSSIMVPSHRKVRSGRDEFRETSPSTADGNPEPSRRYTAGRCRDYLSASVALNDRLERPAPLVGEEIVHSLRKRRGRSESLGPRFESERAHQPIIHRRLGMSAGVPSTGACGGSEMTGHGFRSMASTLLNEQGWNRDAIERQLAHSERNSIRAAYNYAEHLPERRRMMQAWSDYLDGLKRRPDA